MNRLHTTLFLMLTAPLGAQDGLGWNQWLGPQRTGISPDMGLLKKWPAGGPELLWKRIGLGVGFSSVSFAGDRIFTMGEVDGEARMMGLSMADGSVQWSVKLGEPGGTRNRGPRGTPSTDGKLVFGLGHDGELVCATVAGKVRWRKNLVRDFGGRMMSGWGFSESPLLDGRLLVLCPGGGKGTVIALDKKSGKEVWRCTELTDRAPYSSLVPVKIGGVRQYLLFTGASVAGVEAGTGKLLWRGDRPGRTAICSTPVYSDSMMFVSSAYNVGCDCFRIDHQKGKFRVERIYGGKQIQSHHGGMVLVDGYVYGIGRRNLKCIELKTGKVMWEDKSVGKGSITCAEGYLIVRSERSAEVALVEATPAGYREKGRFTPPDRTEQPAWAYPVVFGGKLYIRDQDTLHCFSLRGE